MTMSPSQWALLVLLSVLWGGSFFFVGVAVKEVPPLTLVMLRVSLAALALAPAAILIGLTLPRTLAAWWPFVVMAVIGNVIPFLLIVNGQRYLASGLAAVLNASTPLWSLILGHLLTADEKLAANKLAGVLVGILGVAALIGPEALIGSRASAGGMLMALGAALSYAVSGIWGRRFKETPPLVTASCQLVAAAVILIPVALLIDRPWEAALPSGHVIAAIFCLALVSTALGHIVFFRIMSVSGPTNAMLVTLLIPISAITLGVLLLGETLAVRHLIGAMIIGVALILIDGRLIALRRPSAV